MAKAPKPVETMSDDCAGGRYAALENDRNVFLQRGRECSLLTVPSILPPAGFSAASRLPTPYQSLGARGVRTLASKLLLSLFPSNTPFFEYKIDDQTLAKLGAKRGEFEKALASRERATCTELDTSVFRPAAFQALTHLIVTGNAMFYLPKKQGDRAQMYRIDQYVTRRDPAGNLMEAIIRERLDVLSLPLDLQARIAATKEFAGRDKNTYAKTEVDLFTSITLKSDGKYHVFQEACGVVLPGTEGTYTKENMPYFALRFSSQPGEHYGRGYVEEYLGDLDSLEALSEALVEGSAASARIVFMVNPSGVTSLKVVATAKTGDTVSGNAEDVKVMQVMKGADLEIAKKQAEEISTRLSYAFLLHSAVQRTGDRVTASEIRYMASELDDGLGGVYTLLAADFQSPCVRLFEKRMEARLKVPELPSDMVHPVLISGLEAIGRGHDQQNLHMFAQDIIQVLTPQIAAQYLNFDEYLKRASAGYGIDPEGLVKSAEEVQAAQQQAQQAQMMQTLGPQAIQAAGKMGAQHMSNQAAASKGPPKQ